MKTLTLDCSALHALPLEKALQLLSAQAQQVSNKAPAVTPAEALIITGAIHAKLHDVGSYSIGRLVRDYAYDVHGIATGIEDTVFSTWLDKLTPAQASALTIQCVCFGVARQLVAHAPESAVNLNDFFRISNRAEIEAAANLPRRS